MLIRAANHGDIAGITAIYNEVISTSDAIYREVPVPETERLEWFDAKLRDGFPVLVAEIDSSIAGYGVFGNFRFGEGYNHTVEHSVHVREDKRGRGIGTKLLSELIQLAANAGKHVMVAAIDSGNQGSIDLHSKFGFFESARMREVATKNGRLLTLVLMQKLLTDA